MEWELGHPRPLRHRFPQLSSSSPASCSIISRDPSSSGTKDKHEILVSSNCPQAIVSTGAPRRRNVAQRRDSALHPSEKEVLRFKLKHDDIEMLFKIWSNYPTVYRIHEGTSAGGGPSLLQQVCRERGWVESDPQDKTRRVHGGYNLWWTSNGPNPRNLAPYQLSNHIPGSSNMFCRKDMLVRYLRRMKQNHGFPFDFCPLSYNLPLDYTRLCTEHSRRYHRLQFFTLNYPECSLQELTEPPIWICKPVGKSQGKGIIIFNKITELVYDNVSVVQEYVHTPLLIGGYKWDLRIYVAIASVRPLTIYAYREGITRFATEKFDLNTLLNPYAHLTNCSLNKAGPNYHSYKDTVGKGCKWTLERLRNYFFESQISDWFLWQKIWSILVLTIIGEGSTISNLPSGNSFEFLGFDIIVDRNMRPTLLEVNVNPGLNNDCEVDRIVKKKMIHELFDLVLLPDGRVLHKNYGSHVEAQFIQNLSNGEPILPLTLAAAEIKNQRPGTATKIVNDRKAKSKKAERPPPATTAKCYDVFLPKKNEKILKGDKKLGGAGMMFEFRNWYDDAPNEVGDWVKIFPFNRATKEIAKNIIIEKDIKHLVSQVSQVIKSASRIVKGNSKNADEVYDAVLESDKNHFFGPTWHPAGPSGRNSGPKSLARTMALLAKGRPYTSF